MKSILLHVNDDAGAESRLQAACDLVRAVKGRLRCVQVAPLPDFISADFYGGAALAPDILADLREADERFRKAVEERLHREGVSWSWRRSESDTARSLLAATTLADLILVTLPEGPRQFNGPPDLAGDLALSARAPVMAVPQTAGSLNICGRALALWDGSPEASAALRAAVPLLRLAEDVQVVTVEEAGKLTFPATDAPEYLASHGIASQLQSWPLQGRSVEDALLSAVRELRPDWVVMGAFGHSRLREFMFGGVTRAMLRDASVPILLAH